MLPDTHVSRSAARTIDARLIPPLLLAVAACLSLTSDAYAQGSVGHRYASVAFLLERPNDEILRAFSDWGYGALATANVPLSAVCDLNLEVDNRWFGGDSVQSGTPMNLDATGTLLSAMLIGHLDAQAVFDPFLGVGVGYQNVDMKLTSGGAGVATSEDGVLLNLRAGAEWRPATVVTFRSFVASRAPFEDFDAGELFDGPWLETQAIFGHRDGWFGGVSLGSDFDAVDVQLGFFTGLAGW